VLNKNKIKVNFHSSICLNGNVYIDPLEIKKETKNAKVVFITHTHWDHLDEDSINKVKNSNTIFVCPKDAEEKLEKFWIDKKNIITVEPNMKFKVLDISCETFPAYNLQKDFHPKENGWVGFKLVIEGESFVICGDTDVTEELKQIKTDVLFVPIGGIYTMDAEEAAYLTNIIKPKLVVPMHYGKIVGGKQAENVFLKKLNKNIESLILIKK